MGAVFSFLRTVAAVLAAITLAIGILESGILDPVPYRNATVTEVTLLDDGRIRVIGEFIKTEEICTPQRLIAYAILPQSRTPLALETFQQAGEDIYRLPGYQTFEWVIDPYHWMFDVIEVWTRHECEGREIDLLMVSFEVPGETESDQ